MPSHKIHLAIAKKVNDKINKDLDSIMLGSILPDLANEKDHSIAHYQSGNNDFEGLANPERFLEKHKDKLDNPVMIGYLIHILTDRFYNEFMFKNFYIYDEKQNGIGIYLKGKKKLLNGLERKHIKHRDFWVYDCFLMNHGYVCKFSGLQCIDSVIDTSEATFNKEKLKEYILSSNKDIDKINFLSKIRFYNYKISNQKTMDKLFDDCTKFILEYLEKIKI